MAENKIDITKQSYLDLINKVYTNKLEERELALDRYRLADEQMESAEQFVLMGKNAVSFLTVAADSTTKLAELAKEIKSIVFKDDATNPITSDLSDDWKKGVAEVIEKQEKDIKKSIEIEESVKEDILDD